MRRGVVFGAFLVACTGQDRSRSSDPLPAAPQPDRLPAVASFACDAARQDVRTCVYSSPRGRVRIVDSLSDIRRLYVGDSGQWRELPRFYGNAVWGHCALAEDRSDVPRTDRVAIADVDGDGRDDVVVVADCITGIGPTGAQPFAVGTIYGRQSPARYAVADARDSTFTEALPESCNDGPCDVVAAARTAVRGAGRR